MYEKFAKPLNFSDTGEKIGYEVVRITEEHQ